MDISEFIRQLIGMKRPPTDHGGNASDGIFFPDDEEEGWQNANVHNNFDDFHIQMQILQKQMEDMFKGFGSMEFQPSAEDHKSDRFVPKQSDARDSMLKEPTDEQHRTLPHTGLHNMDPHSGRHDMDPHSSRHNMDVIIMPAFPSSFFGGFFGPGFTQFPDHPRLPGPEREDHPDKDSSLVDGPMRFGPSSPHHSPVRSFGSSVSVRTVRGRDGVVVETRTVRDSTGKEETTVTRRLGNQSHTVTTKKDIDGSQEKNENYINMDEKKLSDFDTKLEGRSSLNPCQCPSPDSTKKDNLLSNLSTWALFKKIIGWDD